MNEWFTLIMKSPSSRPAFSAGEFVSTERTDNTLDLFLLKEQWMLIQCQLINKIKIWNFFWCQDSLNSNGVNFLFHLYTWIYNVYYRKKFMLYMLFTYYKECTITYFMIVLVNFLKLCHLKLIRYYGSVLFFLRNTILQSTKM